jgi:hypothetical protein
MFIETIGNSHSGRHAAGRQYLLSCFVALAFALTIYSSKAQAQIVGDLHVKIPFQFHAGNAKLPAGDYRIHALDDSDLTIMEIISADGSASVLFQVQDTEANSTPAKNELIFNKYGNRYFLAKVFEEGSSSGSQVLESRYEKSVSHETMEAQEHVAAQKGRQRRN